MKSPDELHNNSRKFMASLPEPIRRRVYGLKALDAQTVKLMAEYTGERDLINDRCDDRIAPLNVRRREILGGSAVTAEELQEAGATAEAIAARGTKLPEFWLRALKHHRIVDSIISERDEECLKHLINVSADGCEKKFTISFVFGPNDYFEQSELTKTFELTDELEPSIKTTVATIPKWKPRKNLTVETITTGKGNKKKKTTEPCASLFRFFLNDDDDEDGEDWYSFAMTLRQKIIPFAVEYYLGEASDGSSDIDSDMYDEDEDDEEEEDEDEEESDEDARGGRLRMAAPRGGGGAAKETPQDCKQQ